MSRHQRKKKTDCKLVVKFVVKIKIDNFGVSATIYTLVGIFRLSAQAFPRRGDEWISRKLLKNEFSSRADGKRSNAHTGYPTHRYLRILRSLFALKRTPGARLGGAFSCSLNPSGVTRGKTARSACIIRKFARDLRAADKKLSCAIASGYAKRKRFISSPRRD